MSMRESAVAAREKQSLREKSSRCARKAVAAREKQSLREKSSRCARKAVAAREKLSLHEKSCRCTRKAFAVPTISHIAGGHRPPLQLQASELMQFVERGASRPHGVKREYGLA